jgi:seryl-tRNA synthetase
MLDIKLIRSNPEDFRLGIIKRGEASLETESNKRLLDELNIDSNDKVAVLKAFVENSDRVVVEKILPIESLDKKRRAAIYEMETLKQERNKASKEIGRRKAANESAQDIMQEMKAVSEKIKGLEKEVESCDKELNDLLMTIPNLPAAGVPLGPDESANVQVSKTGEVKELGFTVKDHVDLGSDLGILDLDRAAKLTGSRFSVLKGQGARLERALINFMLDVHTRKHGYQEVLPPFICNSSALKGTGQLPKFAEDLFRLENTDYYLIPTAEVPLTNLFAGEIIPEGELTKKITAYTPCFRSEAGSYGKDTRGLIRQHQFDKVELVKFCQPQDSEEELENLVKDAQEILQLLQLPFRTVLLSSGDMGFSATKTYDLEVWLPSQNCYREISSCSNFTDFQARRASIRFKGSEKKSKPALVHTINGSGLAVGRTWVAILENFQDENGKIWIPEVLQPYMGGKTHIEPEK